MRKTLLGLLLLCLFYSPRAQFNLPSFNYVPQSPTTAAFTRYGEIPVDLSTGVTAINIPVYTLSERGMNIPISISYHASGIKVSDVASSVGLGWTLNAGGVITRQVLGLRDEALDNPLNQRPPFTNTQEFEAYNFARESQGLNEHLIWSDELYHMLSPHTAGTGWYEFYSDRFYYSLANGENGIFRRDFKDGTYKTIPYKPVKIRHLRVAGGVGEEVQMEMITSDGNRYLFKQNHYDLFYPYKIYNSSNSDSIVFYSHVDTTNTNYINISEEFGKPYRNISNQSTEAWISKQAGDEGWCDMAIRESNVAGIMYQGNFVEDEIVLIDSIVGPSSVIRFNYAQDREDYLWGNAHHHPFSRLTNVQVINRSTGELIKTVSFSHNYSGSSSGDKRLMLTSMQAGANGEEKHEFKYNPEALPSYQIYSGNNPLYEQDLWGYYHGTPANNSTMFHDFAPSGAADLFPNEEHTKACILQEIKYPTGGKTVFEYENHHVPTYFYGAGFSSPPADGKVGGLRIKKISSYAYEGATPQIKTYEYVCDLPKEYGYLDYEKFSYVQNTYNYLYEAGDCSRGAGLGLYTTMNVCVGSPMGRYIGGPQAPVYYTQVTEYNGDSNHNAGKTVYNYEFPNIYDFQDITEPRFCGPWDKDFGNFTPMLNKKEEYKNENGQYKRVRITEAEYEKVVGERFSTGFNLTSDLRFNNIGVGGESAAWYHYNFMRGESYFSTLHYSDPIGIPALYLPKKINTYDYADGTNYLKSTTEYVYNQYGQQTTAAISTSKGDVLKTKFTYPVDYPAQSPYNAMVERNIIAPVVEQSIYKSTTLPEVFLQSTKTNYNYWNYSARTWGDISSNQILPQTVATKKGTSNAETRVRYYSYDDKGNPLYVSKENDVRQMYLWSYNKTYPVAQVVNVPEDQNYLVAYSSFETAEDGGSLIGTIIADNTAPTGKRCLQLRAGGWLQYALNANYNFILSYWYKVGSSINVTANSSILFTSQPKNGWIYVKMRVTGTNTLYINGTNSYIDEVRVYPESAQMTSFTYEPGIGITSQCDVNDKITYYSYDASGRLAMVKDDEGNILKKICYNFQGQPDACGENALALWQATGATRCKPCPQNPVYYTNITQGEERDNNPNSDSYGTTRWTDIGVLGGVGACRAQGDWQPTGNVRCITQGGQNTGQQEREMKDMNPCTTTAGNTVWEIVGTNTTACPLPVIPQSLDVSGYYFKQGCGSQQVPLLYYVSMPQGAFTSTTVEDATNKARAEAQRQANANGQCATLYIRVVAQPGDGSSQQFTDYHFDFYSDAAGTVPFTLPVNVAVNFKTHEWFMVNGIYNDNGEIDNQVWYAVAGENHLDGQIESYQSIDQITTWHQELILKPGGYVIIP